MFIDFGACPNLVSELNNLAFRQPRVGEFATDSWELGCSDHGFDGGGYLLSAFDRNVNVKPLTVQRVPTRYY